MDSEAWVIISFMPGLYVHVPFCAKRCVYCDFVITTAEGNLPQQRFLEAFAAECAHNVARFGSSRAFESLYVGGGTPSRLKSQELETFFKIIKRSFQFKQDHEATFECNPADVTDELCTLLAEQGINRISLGVQSFNAKTLAAMNRDHSVTDIENAFARLRKGGIRNISADLILSYPGETVEDARHSLSRMMEFEPEHISLYELVVEPRTALDAQIRSGRTHLPQEEEATRTLVFARDFLKRKGYEHYELLSYARPGYRARHNLIYWANEEYLGLGPGAYSYLNGCRFRFAASVEDYLKKAQAADWSPADEETLTGMAHQAESLVLGLRLQEGVSKGAFWDILALVDFQILRLQEDGLLEQDATHLRLTAKGQLFSETVFSALSLPK